MEYVLGIARNERLRAVIESELEEARLLHERTDEPARIFKSFAYRTLDSWSPLSPSRRQGRTPRPRLEPALRRNVLLRRGVGGRGALYEELYCARGEMENRIKEQQLDLFADRTSCCVMRGNQIRLYFSLVCLRAP